jgi:hypothetical protein
MFGESGIVLCLFNLNYLTHPIWTVFCVVYFVFCDIVLLCVTVFILCIVCSVSACAVLLLP